VETVINICHAVEECRPVTSRYLTCTGEVQTPAVVRAHVGCSIGEVVDLCGGSRVDDPVAVIGGPITGSVETDFETPVSKTTSGILVLSRNHDLVRKKTIPLEFIVKQCKSVCCQCTYCTELCPRHLLGYDLAPHLIMRQIGYGLDAPVPSIGNAVLCSGCGLCAAYACPMGLQPQLVNLRISERLRAEGIKLPFAEREIAVHEMKEYRKIPASRILERLQLSRYGERRLKTGLQTDPDRVEILLKGHAGSASKPLVVAGDAVRTGDVIAEILEDGFGSVIHASIDGRVALVDDERVILERRG
jgi:Na+-translocating ferredoxin:NAD+ oxidoreductase RnfC subunit